MADTLQKGTQAPPHEEVSPTQANTQANSQPGKPKGPKVDIQIVECLVFAILGCTWWSVLQLWAKYTPWLDTLVMFALLVVVIAILITCTIVTENTLPKQFLFSAIFAFWLIYIYCLSVSLMVYNPDTVISHDCSKPIDASSLFTTVLFGAASLHPVGSAVSLALLTVLLLVSASCIPGMIWNRTTQKLWGYTTLVLVAVCLNISLIQLCIQYAALSAAVNFVMLLFILAAVFESRFKGRFYTDIILFVMHMVLSLTIVVHAGTWDPLKLIWPTVVVVLLLNGINCVYFIQEVRKYRKETSTGSAPDIQATLVYHTTPQDQHPGPSQGFAQQMYPLIPQSGFAVAENALFRSVVLHNMSKKQT